jgi:hypothetical protein
MASALPRPQPRSVFVTVLGWAVIVASGFASAISAITALMLLAGSYGTSSGLTLEGLIIIVAPPVTLVAGISLLRRQRWAHGYLVAVLCVVLAYNGFAIIKGPTPQSSYTSAAGVRTTVLASEANYSPSVIALSIGLLVMLLSPKIRAEFRVSRKMGAQPTPPPTESGWRVGHRGRDCIYYDEWRDGTWQRIEIDGEMLTGRAHHVIYFASLDRWRSYPAWARDRRDEIIARIKTAFREPDYEYYGEGLQLPAQPPTRSDPTALADAVPPSRALQRTGVSSAVTSAERKRFAVAVLVIVALLGLAGGMFWFVTDGLGRGETVLPSTHPTRRRSVSRVQEPAQFWASVGIYAAIGFGSLGVAVWVIRATRDESMGRRS